MKKTIFRRWALLSLCALYGVTLLSGAYTALWPHHASAAATPGEDIKVINIPAAQYGAVTTTNVNCVATISNDPETNTDALTKLTTGPGASGLPADALALFNSAQDQNKNFVVINFKPTKNDQVSQAGCDSLSMIQSTTDKTKFYGFIASGKSNGSFNPALNGIQYSFISSASVSTSDSTLTFTSTLDNHTYKQWPLDGMSTLPPGSFSGAGSGGTGGTSVCPGGKFSEVSNNIQEQLCINQYNQEPTVADFATICFRGETFKSSYWGGNHDTSDPDGHSDQMRYTITTNHDNRCGAEQDPAWAQYGKAYFDVDTSQKATDFNLDNDNALQSFQSAMSNTGETNVRLVNINQQGKYYQNGLDHDKQTTIQVNGDDFNAVALYYPASNTTAPDKIITVFQDGGGNEKKFMGSYSKTADGVYTQDGNGNGCSATDQKTHIDHFGVPLNSQPAGQQVLAQWQMIGSDCTATPATVPIKIVIMSANDAPPNLLGNPTSTKDTPTCESNGFSLSWIMCPIVNGLASAVDGIYGGLIQPMLVTSPLSYTSANDPTHSYAIWSNFRIYGDVFLVIALLVVVFGQAIGGGLIDAYSAKKILPRLLIAAILINLSIYIVGALIDITNIIGNGIQDLLSQPFKGADAFTITLSGGASTLGLGAALGLAAGAGAGIWAVATGAAAPIIMFILLFVLLPAFLTFLAILVTVLLRRGLIVLLVVTAPVAFALYCLPNTEQYFRKWWDLLFRTLLVYPIIAVLFSMGNIMSVVVSHTPKTTALLQMLSGIMAIIALIIPLFLIPFAFRIAGGILSKFHETFTNLHKRGQEALKGNPNDPRSLRNRTRRNMRSAYNESRNLAYTGLSDRSKAGTNGGRGIRRRIYGGLARGINYGNLQAERAEMNEELSKMTQQQYSMGDDSNIRAYWAEQYTGDGSDGSGRVNGAWYSPYANADGTYKEWSSSDVAKAHSQVRRNPSTFQAFAQYEAGKVANTDQEHDFKRRFIESANSLGWTSGQANGVWSGIKFNHQGHRKEDKYRNITGGKGSLAFGDIDHSGFSNELVDAMRSGDFAGFRETTPMAATEGLQQARARLSDANFDYNSDEARANKWSREGDQQIEANYEDLAEHLSVPLFGTGAQSEGARLAMERAAAEGAEGAEGVGFGIGASQRATEHWKEFVRTARSGTTQPGRRPTPPPPPQNPGGGSGIIIPPRGYTGSQG